MATTKEKDWGQWELTGVLVHRRNRDDESDIDSRFIPKALAMPVGKCHCTRTWKGGKVFLSVMGHEIECVGDAEAQTLMTLFHLQHGLGLAASTISAVAATADQENTND